MGGDDAGGAAGELGAGEGRQLGVGAEVEERIVVVIVPGTIRRCKLSTAKRLWLVESQGGIEDVGGDDAGGAAGELGTGEGGELGVGAKIEEGVVAGLAAEATEGPGG